MTYTKFFRFAAPSAISGLCPSLSRGKFTEHVLSAENFIVWMLCIIQQTWHSTQLSSVLCCELGGINRILMLICFYSKLTGIRAVKCDNDASHISLILKRFLFSHVLSCSFLLKKWNLISSQNNASNCYIEFSSRLFLLVTCIIGSLNGLSCRVFENQEILFDISRRIYHVTTRY